MVIQDALNIMEFKIVPDKMELKKKFRLLIMKNHPDLNDGDIEKTKLSASIIEANEILSAAILKRDTIKRSDAEYKFILKYFCTSMIDINKFCYLDDCLLLKLLEKLDICVTEKQLSYDNYSKYCYDFLKLMVDNKIIEYNISINRDLLESFISDITLKCELGLFSFINQVDNVFKRYDSTYKNIKDLEEEFESIDLFDGLYFSTLYKKIYLFNVSKIFSEFKCSTLLGGVLNSPIDLVTNMNDFVIKYKVFFDCLSEMILSYSLYNINNDILKCLVIDDIYNKLINVDLNLASEVIVFDLCYYKNIIDNYIDQNEIDIVLFCENHVRANDFLRDYKILFSSDINLCNTVNNLCDNLTIRCGNKILSVSDVDSFKKELIILLQQDYEIKIRNLYPHLGNFIYTFMLEFVMDFDINKRFDILYNEMNINITMMRSRVLILYNEIYNKLYSSVFKCLNLNVKFELLLPLDLLVRDDCMKFANRCILEFGTDLNFIFESELVMNFICEKLILNGTLVEILSNYDEEMDEKFYNEYLLFLKKVKFNVFNTKLLCDFLNEGKCKVKV